MSELTRPRSHDHPHSTSRPFPQYSPTNSAYPGVGQRQCTKCHQWQNPDQFESVDIPCAPRPTPLCLLHDRSDPAQNQEDNRDLEDYNIRSVERTQLLTQLKTALNDCPITPAFWACCQICDKSALKLLITNARYSRGTVLLCIDNSSLIPSLCDLPSF